MVFDIRGQSAVEFTILVGFVLFFFAAFMYAVQSNIADKNFEKKRIEVNEVAFHVRDEINLAFGADDGYSRNFEIPVLIGGLDYSIEILDGLVYLNSTDGRHAISLPVGNVTGEVMKGNNLIRKSNGIVYLNE